MNQPVMTWEGSGTAQREHWLSLECASDVASCGGKAFNLGRMLRAGMPVPAGGVLTVHALEDFLRASGLQARIDALSPMLTQAAPSELARIETDVRDWFEAAPMPDQIKALIARVSCQFPKDVPLAVRSSAVGEDACDASCAGLMDSVLGVHGADSIESALKQVWASRWSARALAYRRNGATRLGGIAAIVQIQIEPRLAGVLFTRSPESGRGEEMLCEYCTGLADKLVAGAIDPARVRISRSDLTCRREEPSDAAAEMSVGDIEALGTAALAAERLFGMPQDIEWALDPAGRIWLVQARPITAQTSSACPSSVRRLVVWSNANVNENFPDPISPLLYSVVAPGYTNYFANLGRAFGLAASRLARMRPDLTCVVGVHAGRLYYNLTAIHAVLRQAPFGERLVSWFDDFTGAFDPSAPGTPKSSFVRGLRDALELGWIALRTTRQYLLIERRIQSFEARIDAYAARSAPERLAELDLLVLRDLLREFLDVRLRRWTDASLADAAAMVCYGLLKAIVARALSGQETTATHNDLLKGLSGLKSAEPVDELWRLARQVRSDPRLAELFRDVDTQRILLRLRSDPAFSEFKGRFERYVVRWGFRCSGELMLTVPSFQERPEELLAIVRSYAEQPERALEARLAKQRGEREETTKTVLAAAAKRRLFARSPWPTLANVFAPMLSATQASIALRERARFKQALLYNRLRRVALEIGARLAKRETIGAQDDVFFLTISELDELLSGRAMFPDEVGVLIRQRREAHVRFSALMPADVLIAAEGEYPRTTSASAATAPREHGAGLRGSSVCGGVATGRAKVLTNVAQTRDLAPGDVLVTRQTDPGWAPAFVAIGALVLERGGMLSHGAILAREYGIPTVVGVVGATERIAHDSVVRVDGDRGEVHCVPSV